MPEGLDPVDVGRELHKHSHDRNGEEDGEPATGGPAGQRATGGRHGRRLQIYEALLLALVTETAAWAGYAAAE